MVNLLDWDFIAFSPTPGFKEAFGFYFWYESSNLSLTSFVVGYNY